MTLREKQYTPLPITWLPGIPVTIAPPASAPQPTTDLKILPKLGLLVIALGLISFAAYWSGRNAVQPDLEQAQAALKLEQAKAKELNNQLYDANQALQANQQASMQVQAIRAIVCPEAQAREQR